MIIALVFGALAVFAVWEFLLDTLPWRIPPVLQPFLVGGLGYASTTLSHQILIPVAIAGAVLLLHTWARRASPVETTAVQLPRSGRRTEIGSRIPTLPGG